MKKSRLLLILALPLSLVSCGGGGGSTEEGRVEDTRNLDPFENTALSYSATDALGRQFSVADLHKEGKKVGIFYHIWHGYHNNGIYDVTKLLHDNPEALYNLSASETASPLGEFHYWGEPLYGYYKSEDPWVITRHMEIMMAAGIDYLCYDLTNAVIYDDAINTIFQVLDKYQKQGFNVPKVCFYTNSYSGKTMKTCYDRWYKPTSKNYYPNLWYSHDGKKPFMIGVKSDLKTNFPDVYDEMLEKLDIRESQWPNVPFDREEGFPWMDWKYEQRIFKDGSISVSLAQHPGCNCALEANGTNGRGYDHDLCENSTARVPQGENFEDQYRTALNNEDKVSNVFVTGFNEWIAIKQKNANDQLLMVDTFNEEYSRDVEMFRGYKDQKGYGDNYVMQMARLNRKFKLTEGKHYKYKEASIDINDLSEAQWSKTTNVYMDFAGDAMARSFKGADSVIDYIDNSNRNDIVKTTVTHDAEKMYFRVECLENITEKDPADKSWMNLLISTNNADIPNGNGYNFVLNREVSGGKASVESLGADYKTTKVGEAEIKVDGKIMQIAIPLSLLGKTEEDAHIGFKVADHVSDPTDIMEYYISGDSAPIGRFNYTYGF